MFPVDKEGCMGVNGLSQKWLLLSILESLPDLLDELWESRTFKKK